MTCTFDAGERAERSAIAEKITELTALIQELPREARRLLDAVEDGLTIGPAQITDDPSALDDDEDSLDGDETTG